MGRTVLVALAATLLLCTMTVVAMEVDGDAPYAAPGTVTSPHPSRTRPSDRRQHHAVDRLDSRAVEGESGSASPPEHTSEPFAQAALVETSEPAAEEEREAGERESSLMRHVRRLMSTSSATRRGGNATGLNRMKHFDGLDEADEAEEDEEFTRGEDLIISPFFHVAPMRERTLPARFDVTLITQFSMDRMHLLEKIVADGLWRGPVSLALYVKRDVDEDVRQLLDLVQPESSLVRSLPNVDIHVVFGTKDHAYPTNHLRRLAADYSRTEVVFNIDGDFFPSGGLEDVLTGLGAKMGRNSGDNSRASKKKMAFIAPAFELDTIEHGVPRDKDQLTRLVGMDLARQFHVNHFATGHQATDYSRWMVSSTAYRIEYENLFEPYVLLIKPFPQFDCRFSDGYFDKQAHAHELWVAGYEFIVIPNEFVIHLPHENTRIRVEKKDRSVIQRHYRSYKRFSDEVKERHGSADRVRPEHKVDSGYVFPGHRTLLPNLARNTHFVERGVLARSPAAEWKGLPCNYDLVDAPGGGGGRAVRVPLMDNPYHIEPCGASQLVLLGSAAGSSASSGPRARYSKSTVGLNLGERGGLAGLLVTAWVRTEAPIRPSSIARRKRYNEHCAIVVSVNYAESDANVRGVTDQAVEFDVTPKGTVSEDDMPDRIRNPDAYERYKAGWVFRQGVVPVDTSRTATSAMVLLLSFGVDPATPCFYSDVSVLPVPARLPQHRLYPFLYTPSNTIAKEEVAAAYRKQEEQRQQQWQQQQQQRPQQQQELQEHTGTGEDSAAHDAAGSGAVVVPGAGGNGPQPDPYMPVFVVLTSHCSVDRLDNVQAMCEAWQGPMSLAVHVFDVPKELDVLDSYLSGSSLAKDPGCLARWASIHLSFDDPPSKSKYPINYLRNVAISFGPDYCTHVFPLDADLVPVMSSRSPDLAATIRKFGSNYAFVVPAFQYHDAQNKIPFPKSKEQLFELNYMFVKRLNQKAVTTFDGNTPASSHFHKATDYPKWYLMTRPDQGYEVPYNEEYEPFFILSRELSVALPWDETFTGYGYNKISYTFNLNKHGIRFAVTPLSFVLHRRHEHSDSRKAWSGTSAATAFYRSWRWYLQAMAGGERSVQTEQCPAFFSGRLGTGSAGSGGGSGSRFSDGSRGGNGVDPTAELSSSSGTAASQINSRASSPPAAEEMDPSTSTSTSASGPASARPNPPMPVSSTTPSGADDGSAPGGMAATLVSLGPSLLIAGTMMAAVVVVAIRTSRKGSSSQTAVFFLVIIFVGGLLALVNMQLVHSNVGEGASHYWRSLGNLPFGVGGSMGGDSSGGVAGGGGGGGGGGGDLGNSRKLKVYVYDIPASFNTDLLHLPVLDHSMSCVHGMFSTEVLLHWWLLNDASVRTTNPMEADLFFVPVYSTCYRFTSLAEQGSRFTERGVANFVLDALNHVQTNYPYWSRSKGADHVFVFSHDYGVCHTYLEQHTRPPTRVMQQLIQQFRNAIVLSPYSDLSNVCFNPHKDVAIPPFVKSQRELRPRDTWQDLLASWKPVEERTHLAMFWGSINWARQGPGYMSPDYSHGIRQAIWKQYKDLPGVLLVDSSGTAGSSDIQVTEQQKRSGWVGKRKPNPQGQGGYQAAMRDSVFCICPPGWALWSPRIVESVDMGCVPVIIGDNIVLPFEKLLDYREFSIKIGEEDVMKGKLLDILKSIPQEVIAKKRENLARHWPAFQYALDPSFLTKVSAVDPQAGFQSNLYTLLRRELALRTMGPSGSPRSSTWL